MKYLKSYLESNQMIDEGDLETIKDLFKFVEDELMLKRSEGTLEKNEYRIEIKNNKYGAAGNRIFIFARVENEEIHTSEIQKIWSDFIGSLSSYGYTIPTISDTKVAELSDDSVFFGATILYR
jgi:hypothetical protein